MLSVGWHWLARSARHRTATDGSEARSQKVGTPVAAKVFEEPLKLTGSRD